VSVGRPRVLDVKTLTHPHSLHRDEKLAQYFGNYGEVTEAFVRCDNRVRSEAAGPRSRRCLGPEALLPSNGCVGLALQFVVPAEQLVWFSIFLVVWYIPSR